MGAIGEMAGMPYKFIMPFCGRAEGRKIIKYRNISLFD